AREHVEHLAGADADVEHRRAANVRESRPTPVPIPVTEDAGLFDWESRVVQRAHFRHRISGLVYLRLELGHIITRLTSRPSPITRQLARNASSSMRQVCADGLARRITIRL